MDLRTPIAKAGRRYAFFTRKLEKLGIKKLEDFLFHIPHRYDDLSLISPIGKVQEGEIITIQGLVDEIKNDYTRRRFRLQRAQISDETGTIECIWFNQPYITKVIKKGDFVSIAGKVERTGRKLNLMVREYEVLSSPSSITIHTGRLAPVYRQTRGLTSRYLRNRVKELMDEYSDKITEYLPDFILQKYDFDTVAEALSAVHFPKTLDGASKAFKRLAFEELFLTQLSASFRRAVWEQEKVTNVFSITPFNRQIKDFWQSLPFELTNSQKKAVSEIFSDLAFPKPMNRLLQGDVGSGKTVVAAAGMYVAKLNGFQSVLMAPTEILANQHYETITKLLSGLGLKVGLVTGNKKVLLNGMGKAARMGKVKRRTSNDTSVDTDKLQTNYDILIGTHALLSESVNISKLGLVVIDEQQRFGVVQRTILREKGVNPHFLTMTATPIPRTIFLTLYGDLDLSYLDEMPKGRQIVKTWLVPEEKRQAGYEWIKKQIRVLDNAGNRNQVFIICPFIEESETMKTVKAAVKEYKRLKKDIFYDFNMGLLHGKLKASEKTKVLTDFARQKIDILVATPVVEVGIDIPNATIMVIEAAERFGLAQLHQLRGRVGRSEKQSYCLLFTQSSSPRTIERLRSLERTHVGAELAEIDLRMRGPGEVYGTMQHGIPSLKIASFSDFELIESTRREVERIFPKLDQFPKLLAKIKMLKGDNIAPD